MKNTPERIAVIGGGVSGLSAAYFLDENPDYEVTLYEKQDYLGGNARTVMAKTPDGRPYAVDPVAYLFFAPRYPYFSAWIKQLNVKTLSFTFENYLWNAHKGKGMLIAPGFLKVLLSPGKTWNYFWNLFLFDQVKKTIHKIEAAGKLNDELLMKDFVKQVPFINQKFLEEVFYPLMTYAFHADIDSMPEQPCGTTLSSYALVVKDPYAAWCFDGGIQTYVKKVHTMLQRTKVKLGEMVQAVSLNKGEKNKWLVTTSTGETHEYDQVILALWPHQAAEVLRKGSTHAADGLKETIQLLSEVELAWCREKNLKTTLEFLNQSGVKTVACSEKASRNIFDSELDCPVAFIMGSEEKGVSNELLKKCSELVKIPLESGVSSLNVSVAAGIAIYEAIRQRMK